MRLIKNNTISNDCPETVESLLAKINSKVSQIILFCTNQSSEINIFLTETTLQKEVFSLACLFFQLLLINIHSHFDYSNWLKDKAHFLDKGVHGRNLITIFGVVRYWRYYFVAKSKDDESFYPFDVSMGITEDGFSIKVISLATKLSTRVSYGASVILFQNFYGWSPSMDSIEAWVLGLGKYTEKFVSQAKNWRLDGEYLIIEVDGKATPTARTSELAKRRGKRKKSPSCCQRHRGRNKRKSQPKKERRKRGDKSKNGKSITLVVMYTLKFGSDGKLHGPINKKVWGSYTPRHVMINWAAEQAGKRGFPPKTSNNIHIVIDGEPCLYKELSKHFPKASFALDICHLEEKIWNVGYELYKEGSEELYEWVEKKRNHLYEGESSTLLEELKKEKFRLSSRAKRDSKKRESLSKLIKYIEKRLDMMNYKKLLEKDLVIASGIIEGSARYVVGERMDCSGMRWIATRAEHLLHLRCIELNGDWENFIEWCTKEWREELHQKKKLKIQKRERYTLQNISNENASEPTEHVME